MKKVYIMFLALIITGVTFGQYSSKQNARDGKVDQRIEVKPENHAKDVMVDYFTDGFESGVGSWTLVDQDGDGQNWYIATATTHGGAQCMTSASWNSSPLTPNNYMISPAIDLTGASGVIFLKYFVAAQDPSWESERYSVSISTTTPTVGAMTQLFVETLPIVGSTVTYFERSINLSAYAGQTVYIAFRHFECTDMFRINIDDVSVYQETVTDGAITGVVAPTNETDCSLTGAEPVTVTIFNNGGVTLTGFQASYAINGGAPVVETVSASIAPATSYDFTFATTANFSTLGYYDMVFDLNITGDANAANDGWVTEVRNTDAVITFEVQSDASSDQEVFITNSATEEVWYHGDYQWDITTVDDICVLDADCYTIEFTAAGANTVIVDYNGTEIYNEALSGTGTTIYGIGGGCAAVDASLTAITTPTYIVPGMTSITGTVLNAGTDAITSYEVTYAVDGGAASAVYTVTGVNIATGATHNFTHNVQWSAALGTHNVVVTIGDVNGGADGNTANNELDKDITVVTVAPVKRVVGEEATGTWCGWCVRGHVFLEYMQETYPDSWIGIAVHNGDPMVVTAYDTGIGGYISGYPSGLVDREPGVETDPADFEAAYLTAVEVIPPVAVNVTNMTWNSTTRALGFDVTSTFVASLSGLNYRMNGVIIENNVTGTTSDYDQANYYSGGTYGPMGGYESLSDPVPAADMVYQNVARALLGGWSGTASSIPASVTSGTTYTQHYTYTVPASYDENELKLIGMVINNADGAIINAYSTPIIVGIGENKLETELVVYPNPSNGTVYVRNAENANVVVMNVLGEVVASFENVSSKFAIDLTNQAEGTYVIKVTENGKVATKRIVITK